MEPQQNTDSDSAKPKISSAGRMVRWLGVVLLVVVFSIHLALFLTVSAMNPLSDTLFLIYAAGALLAAVGVMSHSRRMGWDGGLGSSWQVALPQQN